MTDSPPKTGVVKFVDRTKGYGYIIPAEETDPRRTLLFERFSVQDWWGIYAGQHVTYTPAPPRRALHVRQVEPEGEKDE